MYFGCFAAIFGGFVTYPLIHLLFSHMLPQNANTRVCSTGYKKTSGWALPMCVGAAVLNLVVLLSVNFVFDCSPVPFCAHLFSLSFPHRGKLLDKNIVPTTGTPSNGINKDAYVVGEYFSKASDGSTGSRICAPK
jgi:hypothetical protein